MKPQFFTSDGIDQRASITELFDDELIVDSFAGGGGASEGIRMAFGRDPDIAINHDGEAIAMHKANHPDTEHYNESVWQVDPRRAVANAAARLQRALMRVGLFWLSPDCTDFSKAKGGKPISRKRRALAWVAVRWAKAVRPRVIVLENVEEFEGWGPLLKNDKRNPEKVGFTFRMFVGRLRALGYEVQWRQLRACDYGTPTIRKRLFLVARCDGRPIVWPEATHGPGKLPYRTFAECADFSLPCPSIFMTKKEAQAFYKETGIRVKRPLEEPTLKRIGRGVWRYVINDPDPFIVDGVAPFVTEHAQASSQRNFPATEPLRTICAGVKGGHFAVVAPTLVQTGYGEDKNRNGGKGQPPRALDIRQPLGTIVGGGNKHAVVAAFLAKHFTGVVGSSMKEPLHTVTGTDHNSLVISHLLKLHGSSVQGDLFTKPAPTIRAGGKHLAEVRAFLIQYYSEGSGKEPRRLDKPLPAITGRDRFAIVTVHGQEYIFADIGMRMVTVRERFSAQGFRKDYKTDPVFTYEYRWKKGKKKGQIIRRVTKPLTEEAQGRMVGNSVCPPLACAILRAQFTPADAEARAA